MRRPNRGLGGFGVLTAAFLALVASLAGSSARAETPRLWTPGSIFLGGESRIVFGSDRSPVTTFDIVTMNADGTGQTNLTNSTAADHVPAWSPDGTKIAFAKEVGDGRL